MSKINKCIECVLKPSKTGYGVITLNKTQFRAHRIAYRLYKGKIPKGMIICHSCDNRKCINPDHLWLGTYNDNNKDRAKKGRSTKNKNSAKLTKEQVLDIRNLYIPRKISYRMLAKQFNVTYGTIYHIINNLTWNSNL